MVIAEFIVIQIYQNSWVILCENPRNGNDNSGESDFDAEVTFGKVVSSLAVFLFVLLVIL